MNRCQQRNNVPCLLSLGKIAVLLYRDQKTFRCNSCQTTYQGSTEGALPNVSRIEEAFEPQGMTNWYDVLLELVARVQGQENSKPNLVSMSMG